jgi:hypothetical protein
VAARLSELDRLKEENARLEGQLAREKALLKAALESEARYSRLLEESHAEARRTQAQQPALPDSKIQKLLIVEQGYIKLLASLKRFEQPVTGM